MRIIHREDASPQVIASLEAMIGEPATLEEVLRWGLESKPMKTVSNVVVQDEYTHDVVMPIEPDVVLVWDVT